MCFKCSSNSCISYSDINKIVSFIDHLHTYKLFGNMITTVIVHIMTANKHPLKNSSLEYGLFLTIFLIALNRVTINENAIIGVR